jgi:elongation factor P
MFIQCNNQLYEVLESKHFKIGRGGAVLKTKLKDLATGKVIDQTFQGNQTELKEIYLETTKANFLYQDQDKCHFMETITFDQFGLDGKTIGQAKDYLSEGIEVEVIKWQGQVLNIRLPIKIELKVTYTEPGFKGNTVSATTKPATLETGAEIQVPLFIKTGDSIIIDTRNGKYVERK